MSNNNQTCHGIHNNMLAASEKHTLRFLNKKLWRFKTFVRNALWHIQAKDFSRTLIRALTKIVTEPSAAGKKIRPNDLHTLAEDDALNLLPGELVEIKSEAEILATLDGNKKCKGLFWMPSMRKFCGKQYRVFKRLETILLEATGGVRKIKNTVLLEEVICDGYDFYGCDRSCFYYWREAWLRRVEPGKTHEAINS